MKANGLTQLNDRYQQNQILANRARNGTVAYLVFVVCFGLAAPIGGHNLLPYIFLAVMVSGLALLRFVLCVIAHSWKEEWADLWYKVFFGLVSAQSLIVGLITVGAEFYFGLMSFSFFYLLISLVTLTAGMGWSFHSEMKLSRTQLFLLFVPFLGSMMIQSLIRWSPEHVSILVPGVTFFAFVLAQSFRREEETSELSQLIERVQRREAQVHELAEFMPGPAAWFDRSLCFLGCNCLMLGIVDSSQNFVVGQSITQHPVFGGVFSHSVEAFVSSQKSSDQFEMMLGLKGKEPRWYLILLKKAQLGDSEQILMLLLDVHERKTNARLLQEQKEQLEEASKLSALGELAANIAHEVNNPLAIIIGKAELSARRLNKACCGDSECDVPEFVKVFELIGQTGRRIDAIISSLKQLSRLNPTEADFKPVKLNHCFQEVFPLLEEKIQRRIIDFSENLSEQPNLQVLGSCVEIGRVLTNLIANSMDAVEFTSNPWIRLSASVEGETVSVRIVDSGKGIAPETAQKMMDAFFSTKQVGKGTGLGLSLSKQAIENLGGRLYYDPNASNTTFVIELPKVS